MNCIKMAHTPKLSASDDGANLENADAYAALVYAHANVSAALKFHRHAHVGGVHHASEYGRGLTQHDHGHVRVFLTSE